MPVLGRARSHGDKALGVPDPGAVSLALIARRVHTVIADA
jgi:dihydroxyacetone kinase